MSVRENPEVPVKRFKAGNSTHDSGEPETDKNAGEAVNREWVKKLQQLLSCPVCYEFIRPTVDICSNGHSVCTNCRNKLVRCPICAAEFVKATNITLAQIADYIKYPCPNAIGGCTEVYYLREEESHLKSCVYLVHRCKIDNCDWTGSREELRLHVEALHQEDIWKKDWYFSGYRKFEEEETSTEGFGKFLIIEDELFWMLSSYDSDKKKLYKNFQYIGSKEMADNFVYQICLRSVDDRKQFLFKSIMDDDTRNGSNVFDSPNCTIIDFHILRSFSASSPHFKLKYHYCISKMK